MHPVTHLHQFHLEKLSIYEKNFLKKLICFVTQKHLQHTEKVSIYKKYFLKIDNIFYYFSLAYRKTKKGVSGVTIHKKTSIDAGFKDNIFKKITCC